MPYLSAHGGKPSRSTLAQHKVFWVTERERSLYDSHNGTCCCLRCHLGIN